MAENRFQHLIPKKNRFAHLIPSEPQVQPDEVPPFQVPVPGLAPLAHMGAPTNVNLPDPDTFAKTAGSFALNRYLDNILNIPHAIGKQGGKLLAGASAGLQTLPQVPGLIDEGGLGAVKGEFDRRTEEEMGKFPANLHELIPQPTSLGVQAAAQTIPGTFDPLQREGFADRFSGNREQLLEELMRAQEASPAGATTGNITGDVATLLTGRGPLARGSAQRRLAATPKKPPPAEGTVAHAIDRVINTSVVQGLKSGGIKVGETGLEGAVLAALNDTDPLTMALMAGGSQAAGSTLLNLSGIGPIARGKWGKGAIALTVSAGTTAGIMQMFKSATPGGKDYILESIESGYDKVTALLILGALSGIAGAGRMPKGFRTDIPGVADAITSIPRGTMISILNEIKHNPDDEIISTVMQKINEEPDYFGPAAGRRIRRALRSEEIDPVQVINDLRDADRQFRRQLDALAAGN